jgi:hypothetical protein
VRFVHSDLPGRALRLAYCLNLHAAQDIAGVVGGMLKTTLPLRDRLAAEGQRFGVGMYFPAPIAARLTCAEGAAEMADLQAFLERERLDPFTFNAFPFGNFHRAGLKRDVFRPTWCEDERLEYTLQVAQIAHKLAKGGEGHLSISTHPGRFGPFEEGEFELAVERLRQVVEHFAALEKGGGPRIKLALEAEPRAAAGDTASLARLLKRLCDALIPGLPQELVHAHLGACLDTCHAAVEFESVADSLRAATVLPLGKVQLSSAISLRSPGAAAAAREHLLGLDEPRYLHQTTGRLGNDFLRTDDLPELSAALEQGEESPWLACDEWRTHFHVPINLERLADTGLRTTRAQAMGTLEALLDDPACWGSPELHLEIETYTWDILPREAGGELNLVDGLEAEYRPVMNLLLERGWEPDRG